MAVILELSIQSDAFDLGRVTKVVDGVHLELERVVPLGEEVMPFFWAEGAELETFERRVRNDELVDNLNAVTRVGDRVLYQVEWGESVSNLTRVLKRSKATILHAEGNDPWLFTLRFNDHRGLTEFHTNAQDEGIQFTVDRVYTLEERTGTSYDFGLTEQQREALLAAVEGGYFEVPRRITLQEIASMLDVSHQAVSERVRRGSDTVLRAVLLDRSAADLVADDD